MWWFTLTIGRLIISVSRRIIAVVAALAVLAGIILAFTVGRDGSGGASGGASSSEADQESGPAPVASAIAPASAVVDHSSAHAAALGVSQAMYESAPVVIVSADDSWTPASYGAALGVPVLIADGAGPDCGRCRRWGQRSRGRRI